MEKTMKTAAMVLAMAACALADNGREDAVRKLETMRVTVDFENVKLPEAVDYLRDVTGLNRVILPKAMEKDGETPIRLKVKELSVKSVLKLLLNNRGLTATYRDGALVILPKEDLQSDVTMRIFDVRALQVKIQDFAGPKVELVAKSSKPDVGIFTIDEPHVAVPDDFLQEMVKTNTGNGNWDSNPRASMVLTNGSLVVSQSPNVLREIENLLNLLGQYQ
jgi:type II secretory pathway component GspD/PulD (secretin)